MEGRISLLYLRRRLSGWRTMSWLCHWAENHQMGKMSRLAIPRRLVHGSFRRVEYQRIRVCETVGIERDQRLRCFASLVAAIKHKLGKNGKLSPHQAIRKHREWKPHRSSSFGDSGPRRHQICPESAQNMPKEAKAED